MTVMRCVAWVLIMVMTFNSIVVASDLGLEVDRTTGASSVPIIDESLNGVPIIHIAEPSSGGVSDNDFRDFNVGKEGTILNNSLNGGESVLGGDIYGNPNFYGQTADTVLIDVTGTNPSDVNGFIEMFGDEADFILANPNGININGGGFINMNRATLTTGQTFWDGDRLFYDIESGHIQVGENGLWSQDTLFVDILSQTVELSGPVVGTKNSELTVIVGQNNISHDDLAVEVSDSISIDDAVALDSQAVGGMYHGKIKLISTQFGASVHVLGDVVTYADDIEITASGDIVYNTLYSFDDIKLKASGIVSQNGLTYATGNVVISGVEGVSLGSDGVFADAIYAESDAYITLDGARIPSDSAFISAAHLILDGGRRVSVDSSLILANTVEIEGESVSLNNTQFFGEDSLSIESHAQTISGSYIADYNHLELNADGEIRFLNSGVVVDELKFKSEGVSLNQGSELIAMTVEITANSVAMNGRILGYDEVLISANDVSNSGFLYSGSQISINGSLDVQDGIVESSVIAVVGNDIVIDQGVIIASRDIILQAGQLSLLNNTYVSAPSIVLKSDDTELLNSAIIGSDQIRFHSNTVSMNSVGLESDIISFESANVDMNVGSITALSILFNSSVNANTMLLNSDAIHVNGDLKLEASTLLSNTLYNEGGNVSIANSMVLANTHVRVTSDMVSVSNSDLISDMQSWSYLHAEIHDSYIESNSIYFEGTDFVAESLDLVSNKIQLQSDSIDLLNSIVNANDIELRGQDVLIDEAVLYADNIGSSVIAVAGNDIVIDQGVIIASRDISLQAGQLSLLNNTYVSAPSIVLKSDDTEVLNSAILGADQIRFHSNTVSMNSVGLEADIISFESANVDMEAGSITALSLLFNSSVNANTMLLNADAIRVNGDFELVSSTLLSNTFYNDGGNALIANSMVLANTQVRVTSDIMSVSNSDLISDIQSWSYHNAKIHDSYIESDSIYFEGVDFFAEGLDLVANEVQIQSDSIDLLNNIVNANDIELRGQDVLIDEAVVYADTIGVVSDGVTLSNLSMFASEVFIDSSDFLSVIGVGLVADDLNINAQKSFVFSSVLDALQLDIDADLYLDVIGTDLLASTLNLSANEIGIGYSLVNAGSSVLSGSSITLNTTQWTGHDLESASDSLFVSSSDIVLDEWQGVSDRMHLKYSGLMSLDVSLSADEASIEAMDMLVASLNLRAQESKLQETYLTATTVNLEADKLDVNVSFIDAYLLGLNGQDIVFERSFADVDIYRTSSNSLHILNSDISTSLSDVLASRVTMDSSILKADTLVLESGQGYVTASVLDAGTVTLGLDRFLVSDSTVSSNFLLVDAENGEFESSLVFSNVAQFSAEDMKFVESYIGIVNATLDISELEVLSSDIVGQSFEFYGDRLVVNESGIFVGVGTLNATTVEILGSDMEFYKWSVIGAESVTMSAVTALGSILNLDVKDVALNGSLLLVDEFSSDSDTLGISGSEFDSAVLILDSKNMKVDSSIVSSNLLLVVSDEAIVSNSILSGVTHTWGVSDLNIKEVSFYTKQSEFDTDSVVFRNSVLIGGSIQVNSTDSFIDEGSLWSVQSLDLESRNSLNLLGVSVFADSVGVSSNMISIDLSDISGVDMVFSSDLLELSEVVVQTGTLNVVSDVLNVHGSYIAGSTQNLVSEHAVYSNSQSTGRKLGIIADSLDMDTMILSSNVVVVDSEESELNDVVVLGDIVILDMQRSSSNALSVVSADVLQLHGDSNVYTNAYLHGADTSIFQDNVTFNTSRVMGDSSVVVTNKSVFLNGSDVVSGELDLESWGVNLLNSNLVSLESTNLLVHGVIDSTDTSIFAEGWKLNVDAHDVVLKDSFWSGADDVDIDVQTLDAHNSTITATDYLELTTFQSTVLNNSGFVASRLHVGGPNVVLNKSHIITDGFSHFDATQLRLDRSYVESDRVYVTGGSFQNHYSHVTANILTMDVGVLRNTGILHGHQELNLEGDLENLSSGTLTSGLFMNFDSDTLYNQGFISALNDMTVDVTTLDNYGTIHTQDDLFLTALFELNNVGTLMSESNLSIYGDSEVVNKGVIYGKDGVQIDSSSLENSVTVIDEVVHNIGTITHKKRRGFSTSYIDYDLQLIEQIFVGNAQIISDKDVILNADSIVNYGGQIMGGDVTIESSSLSNQGVGFYTLMRQEGTSYDQAFGMKIGSKTFSDLRSRTEGGAYWDGSYYVNVTDNLYRFGDERETDIAVTSGLIRGGAVVLDVDDITLGNADAKAQDYGDLSTLDTLHSGIEAGMLSVESNSLVNNGVIQGISEVFDNTLIVLAVDNLESNGRLAAGFVSANGRIAEFSRDVASNTFSGTFTESVAYRTSMKASEAYIWNVSDRLFVDGEVESGTVVIKANDLDLDAYSFKVSNGSVSVGTEFHMRGTWEADHYLSVHSDSNLYVKGNVGAEVFEASAGHWFANIGTITSDKMTYIKADNSLYNLGQIDSGELLILSSETGTIHNDFVFPSSSYTMPLRSYSSDTKTLRGDELKFDAASFYNNGLIESGYLTGAARDRMWNHDDIVVGTGVIDTNVYTGLGTVTGELFINAQSTSLALDNTYEGLYSISVSDPEAVIHLSGEHINSNVILRSANDVAVDHYFNIESEFMLIQASANVQSYGNVDVSMAKIEAGGFVNNFGSLEAGIAYISGDEGVDNYGSMVITEGGVVKSLNDTFENSGRFTAANIKFDTKTNVILTKQVETDSDVKEAAYKGFSSRQMSIIDAARSEVDLSGDISFVSGEIIETKDLDSDWFRPDSNVYLSSAQSARINNDSLHVETLSVIASQNIEYLTPVSKVTRLILDAGNKLNLGITVEEEEVLVSEWEELHGREITDEERLMLLSDYAGIDIDSEYVSLSAKNDILALIDSISASTLNVVSEKNILFSDGEVSANSQYFKAVDITAVGTTFNILGNSFMEASGSINLLAAIDELSDGTRLVKSATMNVGGVASFIASGNLNLLASGVHSGLATIVRVSGDVNLLGTVNRSVTYKKESKSEWGHKKTREWWWIDEDAVKSALTSDSSVYVESGGSVHLGGADLKASDNVYVSAIDDITTESLTENYTYRFKKRHGNSRTDTQEDVITHENNAIESNGTITMVSQEGSILSRGSLYKSKGDITYVAEGSVYVQQGEKDYYYFDEDKHAGHIFSSTDKTKTNAQETPDFALIQTSGNVFVKASDSDFDGTDIKIVENFLFDVSGNINFGGEAGYVYSAESETETQWNVLENDISIEDGKFKSRRDMSYKSNSEENFEDTYRKSNVSVGGTMANITSSNRISLVGTNAVVGNYQLKADNGFHLLEDVTQGNNENESVEGTLTVEVVVGHIGVDMVNSAIDGGERVGAGADIMTEQSDALSDIGAGTQVLEGALDVGRVFGNVGQDYASTAASGGFYMDVNLYLDAEQSESGSDWSSTHSSSLIATDGSNSFIQTDEKVVLQGSYLGSNGNASIRARGGIDLLPAVERHRASSTSEAIDAEIQVYSSNPSSEGMPGMLSHSSSGYSSESTNHVGSMIEVRGELDLATGEGGDVNVIGSSIQAGVVDVEDVEGRIRVESVYNTSKSRGHNDSMTIGSINGIATGQSQEDRRMVDNVASITARDEIRGHVSGVDIVGGIVATLDEDGNDVGQNNLTYDELNVSDLEGYHHSYNQNKGLNMDSGLLQNPEGNSTIGAKFADGGFETTQIVRGTFGRGGAETDESVNRDVHNVVTTETKELGGTNFDAVINTEWVTGGERQKRNEDGSLKYDHLGRPVMEDVNGLEAIASDITSVANVHRDLYSGARDFNRLVGAQLRDIQDMLRPEPSEAEQSMLELDISHVEEEILAIGFDRRGNDSDVVMGAISERIEDEVMADFLDEPDVNSLSVDERIDLLNKKLEETPIRFIETTELLLNPVNKLGKKTVNKTLKNAAKRRLYESVIKDMEGINYNAPIN